MPVTIAGLSDVGCVKTVNEDAWLAESVGDVKICVLADGVSAGGYGEIASRTTIDAFQLLIDEEKLAAALDLNMRSLALSMAVHRAHNDIGKKVQGNPQWQGMACTCLVAMMDASSVHAQVVGDSRLYLFSDHRLEQKSEDQTVAEQLLKNGRITDDEVATHPDRNTLAQALGVERLNHPMEPEGVEFEWGTTDLLLLCSDGLTDLVDDATIAQVLAEDVALKNKAEKLIELAKQAGGRDNITVILVLNE